MTNGTTTETRQQRERREIEAFMEYYRKYFKIYLKKEKEIGQGKTERYNFGILLDDLLSECR